MTEEIKIDRGIPLPLVRGRFSKYPWGELKIGESFLIKPEDAEFAQQGARHYAKRFAEKAANGCEFVIRKTTDGFRIWRSK